MEGARHVEVRMPGLAIAPEADVLKQLIDKVTA
jgi:hypothetical protein